MLGALLQRDELGDDEAKDRIDRIDQLGHEDKIRQ
jgi:hypothetical protein